MDCWVHHSGWSFLHGIRKEFICIHNAPHILLTSACLEMCIRFLFFFSSKVGNRTVHSDIMQKMPGMMNNTTESKAEVH